MGHAQELQATVLALINAPFEDDGWRQGVEMIGAVTRSRSMHLVGFGGPLPLSLNLFVGPDAPLAERHFAKAELWGACNWRVHTSRAAMTIQHEPHYADYRSQVDTADYDDSVADLDMRFGCQSALILERDMFLRLAMLRGRRDGACDAGTLEDFALLAHHLHRALRTQIALDGEAAELMLGDNARVSGAVFLLDRHSAICAMTPCAEALMNDGPFIFSATALALRHPGEDRHLRATMARMLAFGDEPAGSRVNEVRVGRSEASPSGRWRMFIVRLPGRAHGLGFDPHLAVSIKPIDRESVQPPLACGPTKPGAGSPKQFYRSENR